MTITPDVVGYTGGFVSAITFLPQVIKIWKTKSVRDLSSLTLLLLFVNVSLWLTYGILVNARPIMVTNGIVLSMIIVMIYFKYRFRNNNTLDRIDDIGNNN